MASITPPEPPCGTVECDELVGHLVTAIEGRTTIGIAIGLLMERHTCDPDAAFDLLRRSSQDRNVKLRDVAAQIAARPRTSGGGARPPLTIDLALDDELDLRGTARPAG